MRQRRRVLVATPVIRELLERRGFANVRATARGVDLELSIPSRTVSRNMPRPVFLYVGRVAVREEHGGGSSRSTCPARRWWWATVRRGASSSATIPTRSSCGAKTGVELASYYQRADVFVFPSRTDTFGLVLVEAMACGTPVAAFPVRGPVDVVAESERRRARRRPRRRRAHRAHARPFQGAALC